MKNLRDTFGERATEIAQNNLRVLAASVPLLAVGAIWSSYDPNVFAQAAKFGGGLSTAVGTLGMGVAAVRGMLHNVAEKALGQQDTAPPPPASTPPLP